MCPLLRPRIGAVLHADSGHADTGYVIDRSPNSALVTVCPAITVYVYAPPLGVVVAMPLTGTMRTTYLPANRLANLKLPRMSVVATLSVESSLLLLFRSR